MFETTVAIQSTVNAGCRNGLSEDASAVGREGLLSLGL
jgi:hypothetical protein